MELLDLGGKFGDRSLNDRISDDVLDSEVADLAWGDSKFLVLLDKLLGRVDVDGGGLVLIGCELGGGPARELKLGVLRVVSACDVVVAFGEDGTVCRDED